MNIFDMGYDILIGQAIIGNFDNVKYLIENRNTKIYNCLAINRAAENNHIDIVIYLLKNGSPIDKYTLYRPLISGHIEIADYIALNVATASLLEKHISENQNKRVGVYMEKYRMIYKNYQELLNKFIVEDVTLIIISYLM